MKILITGGARFTGAAVARASVRKGGDPIFLDRLSDAGNPAWRLPDVADCAVLAEKDRKWPRLRDLPEVFA